MNYANMLPGGGDGEKLFGFSVNERMLGTVFLPSKILPNSRGQYTKGQIMCKVNIEIKHFISNNLLEMAVQF